MYRLNVDTILQTISYAFLNDLPVLEVLYFLLFLLHFYYIFYGPKPFITRPHFCVCPKPGNAFPTSYLVVLWVQWVKVRDFCSCFWKTKHRNKLYTKKCSFKKCATCYQCTFRIVLDVVPGLFHLKWPSWSWMYTYRCNQCLSPQ